MPGAVSAWALTGVVTRLSIPKAESVPSELLRTLYLLSRQTFEGIRDRGLLGVHCDQVPAGRGAARRLSVEGAGPYLGSRGNTEASYTVLSDQQGDER